MQRYLLYYVLYVLWFVGVVVVVFPIITKAVSDSLLASFIYIAIMPYVALYILATAR